MFYGHTCASCLFNSGRSKCSLRTPSNQDSSPRKPHELRRSPWFPAPFSCQTMKPRRVPLADHSGPGGNVQLKTEACCKFAELREHGMWLTLGSLWAPHHPRLIRSQIRPRVPKKPKTVQQRSSQCLSRLPFMFQWSCWETRWLQQCSQTYVFFAACMMPRHPVLPIWGTKLLTYVHMRAGIMLLLCPGEDAQFVYSSIFASQIQKHHPSYINALHIQSCGVVLAQPCTDCHLVTPFPECCHIPSPFSGACINCKLSDWASQCSV